MSKRLVKELGDALWQVFCHARLAEQEGLLSMAEVLEALAAKMKRRNPHVFGTAHASTPEEVNHLWAAVKAQERAGMYDR